MIRLLRFLILLIIIIAIVALGYLWIARASILERFLTKRLNAKVTIEKVQIGWGHLKIEGLRLANPPSSTLPYAFQSSAITLDVSPFELFGQTIYIDRLNIQNPLFGIELYNSIGSDNNWARILGNLPTGGNRKFVIKKLTILNLQFEVVQSNKKSLSIPAIPLLEFDNLGEKGGLSLSQVGRLIFQTILQTLTSKAHLGALLDNVKALPQNLLEGVTSTLPLEKAKGAIKKEVETLQKKSKEASKFLEDLFSSN